MHEKCYRCDGIGYTVKVALHCCGNTYPGGECRATCCVPVEQRMPCEHCQTTGREPLGTLLI